MKRFLTVMSLLMVLFLNAQVGIGIINPESSAMLDVTSTSKGFLPPRMTYAQRSTITSPAIGLIIFCTNCGSASVGGELQVFSGGIWRNLAGTAASFATPTIASTIAASNISFTTATSGGNITSDGGSTISARGVCWSTSQNPTIANSKTIDAGTTGTFTSSLTGLTPNTTYYVSAYATNAQGTTYATQTSFTTLAIAAPTVASTTAASAISYTTATSGGDITSDGGSAISARGVCWSTTQNPTTANSKTIDAGTTGTFTSSLTGLTPNTTYYVRSYATNAQGTNYATQTSFTTLAVAAPTLASTTSATNISTTTATSGGNVTSDGGTTITARGVCWSTSQNPTTSNSKTIDAGTTGTFTSSLTGLTLNTLYYVRSYATNSSGTSYGTQISFTTLNTQPTAGSLNFIAAGSNIPNGNIAWGTTSYLSMTPGLKFGAGAFTIEFWFNTSNFSSRGILGGDNAIAGFLNLHFDHDKSITVDKNGGGGAFSFSTNTSITPNIWHYLVLNRNANGAVAFFIDGVKWTPSVTTSSIDYTAFTPHIGRDYAGGWSGNLTNFRVTIGSAVYDSNATSLTNPNSELTTLTNTKYLMLGSSVTGDASSTQTVTNNNNVSTSTSKPF